MRVTGLHNLPHKRNYTARQFFVTRMYRKNKYTNYNIHALRCHGDPSVGVSNCDNCSHTKHPDKDKHTIFVLQPYPVDSSHSPNNVTHTSDPTLLYKT